MTDCRHCQQPIVYRAGLEWRHDEPNVIWCDPANWRTCTIAAPEVTS